MARYACSVLSWSGCRETIADQTSRRTDFTLSRHRAINVHCATSRCHSHKFSGRRSTEAGTDSHSTLTGGYSASGR